MKAIRVVGDPNNTPSCSSEIIISNLNNGLKKLGIYDDRGTTVVYDCLGQSHGYSTDHIICAYETNIPSIVMANAGGRMLIGVSNQNQSFFINGGYPKDLTAAFTLGVDTNLWKPKLPRQRRDKFVFGMCCDSNTRAAYPELLQKFAKVFGGTNVELYIKDRWATPAFKSYVASVALAHNIKVIHDDEHVTDKQREVEIYDNLDCHIFLNKTSTFALTVAQGMAMQKPTIVMDYSGPRDYCNELNSCLVEYELRAVDPTTIRNLENSYGLRNYLIVEPSLFQKTPEWAVPSLTSIEVCLYRIFTERTWREQIAYNARATAEGMTWERAALNLAWIVNK